MPITTPATYRCAVSSVPVLFPSRPDCRVLDTDDYVHVPNVVTARTR
jgi:hypothetical protein